MFFSELITTVRDLFQLITTFIKKEKSTAFIHLLTNIHGKM